MNYNRRLLKAVPNGLFEKMSYYYNNKKVSKKKYLEIEKKTRNDI